MISASVTRLAHGAASQGVRGLRGAVLAWCCVGAMGAAVAQVDALGSGQAGPAIGPPERTVNEWLLRLQAGSRVPAYTGTFVVTAANGAMSSARIWHLCEGDVQLERVETLSGVLRSTFRRNESVVTFLPASRVVRTEQREAVSLFPNLFASDANGTVADFYTARPLGSGRVAGFDADVVYFAPRDGWRFGYRIWSDKRTGLVLKTQTLDQSVRVLEQAAFSELQFDAPVKAATLQHMMKRTGGYRLEKSDRVRTTADAEGWALRIPVPGFKAQAFYRRAAAAGAMVSQWIFTDGLATVSLFMEPYDVERHTREGWAALGATHTMARRMTYGDTAWWVTAMGEVPLPTLQAFIDGIERKKPL